MTTIPDQFARKIYLVIRKIKDEDTGFKSTIGFITTEKEEADKYEDPNDGAEYTVIELDNILFHDYWIESVQLR